MNENLKIHVYNKAGIRIFHQLNNYCLIAYFGPKPLKIKVIKFCTNDCGALLEFTIT